jgi:hypothetical protein
VPSPQFTSSSVGLSQVQETERVSPFFTVTG